MLLGSIGLALHLLLLQMLGIETSLLLVAGTSHPLAVVAFLAELLGRSVGVIFAGNSSPRSWRPKRWFMLRLTVTATAQHTCCPRAGSQRRLSRAGSRPQRLVPRAASRRQLGAGP